MKKIVCLLFTIFVFIVTTAPALAEEVTLKVWDPANAVVLLDDTTGYSLQRVDHYNHDIGMMSILYAINEMELSEPDMIIVNSWRTDIDEIISNNLVYSTVDPELTSTYGRQSGAYLTKNGIAYGFPLAYYAYLWSIDPGLLKENGFSEPTDMTEWLDDMIQWWQTHKDGMVDHTFDGTTNIKDEVCQTLSYLLLVWARTGIVTFDTPEFRSMLDKLDTLLSL